MKSLRLAALVVTAAVAPGCSGGVPVRIHVDEFVLPISVDEAMDALTATLRSNGLLSASGPGLPVLWPDSLPDLATSTVIATPPMPIDLSPEEGSEEAEKYKDINRVKDAIRRIELNRLILRVEESSLTMALPPLRIQVAADKDASPDDRLAWRTIGTIPGASPEFKGDLELEFAPGGESFLNTQLGDEAKELALRALGKVSIDTATEPRLPSGKALVRLILVATFFVEPEEAL